MAFVIHDPLFFSNVLLPHSQICFLYLKTCITRFAVYRFLHEFFLTTVNLSNQVSCSDGDSQKDTTSVSSFVRKKKVTSKSEVEANTSNSPVPPSCSNNQQRRNFAITTTHIPSLRTNVTSNKVRELVLIHALIGWRSSNDIATNAEYVLGLTLGLVSSDALSPNGLPPLLCFFGAVLIRRKLQKLTPPLVTRVGVIPLV